MLDENDVAFLREHLLKGDLVLFLGAGFSVGVPNVAGTAIPSSAELSESLWQIAFPGVTFDEKAALADVVDTARRRHPAATHAKMLSLLSAEPSSVPDTFRQFLAAPWERIYSLNVDDIIETSARYGDSSFDVRSVNAVTLTASSASENPFALEVVHLNGRVGDGLDAVTFSESDYGARLASPDGFFRACATDILTRPTLFVGTRLLEPTLYQSIELRARNVKTAELLPKSFLVSRNVDVARQARLRDGLKARYIEAAATDFIEWFTATFAGELASSKEKRRLVRAQLNLLDAVDVAELRKSTRSHGPDIALGEEPTWHDVATGALPQLSFVSVIEASAPSLDEAKGHGTVHLVAATAGNGKSTACRALALRWVANGKRVAWLDAASPQFFEQFARVRQEHSITNRWSAVIVDNAQLRIVDIVHEVQALRAMPTPPAIILVARVGALPALRERLEGVNITSTDVALGSIDDSDIEHVLSWLDRVARLGKLSGRSRSQQVKAFKTDARRQLVVALIEATSGRKLKVRVREEFLELDPVQKSVYALVALLSSLGHEVTLRSVLFAIEAPPMKTQRAATQLVGVALLRQGATGRLSLRHRVIAELTLEFLQSEFEFGPVVRSLLVRLAPMVVSGDRKCYEYRVVRSLMNHDFLLRHFDATSASGMLAQLEATMSWDHHYWLQRGSLALVTGAEDDAEIFLLNAYGRNGTDALVLTGLGQVRLRQAVSALTAASAEEFFEEGDSLIREAMEKRLGGDPHHFDILVRSLIDFSRRGDQVGESRRRSLQEAQSLVTEARRRFPNDERIEALRQHLLHVMTETEQF